MERERPPSERGPSLFHPSIRPLHFYTFSITRPGEIFFLFSFFLSSAATVDDTSRCHAHEIREHVCSPGILDIKIHCVSWRSRAYFSIARRKGGGSRRGAACDVSPPYNRAELSGYQSGRVTRHPVLAEGWISVKHDEPCKRNLIKLPMPIVGSL